MQVHFHPPTPRIFMTTPNCLICSHPDVATINSAILGGVRLDDILKNYPNAFSMSTLVRHKPHVPPPPNPLVPDSILCDPTLTSQELKHLAFVKLLASADRLESLALSIGSPKIEAQLTDALVRICLFKPHHP